MGELAIMSGLPITKINVLILCATNETADLVSPKQIKLIKDITGFDAENVNFYYVGENMIHTPPKRCVADITQEFIDTCKYNSDVFNIVISEFCPISMMTVLTDKFFNSVRRLLKMDGKLILQKPVHQRYTINTEHCLLPCDREFARVGFEILSSKKLGITNYFVLGKL